MVLFPNAKINLGLNIIRKRPDGYHDLETIFYPIAIYDALEVITNENAADEVRFSLSGIPVQGGADDNLCIKAYGLLKKDFPGLSAIKTHLHKAIPAGAGLGGGSADGAFMLKLLNQKFHLKLSAEQLLNYALQLGSDGPFFIINKPCFARGRGELLEPISVDLSGYKLVIVNPGIHVNTAEAFSLLKPSPHSKSIKELVRQPLESWKELLRNDFEELIFKKFPVIETIKEKLYESGAIYASMTGSGSTVYGVFRTAQEARINMPPGYFVKELVS